MIPVLFAQAVNPDATADLAQLLIGAINGRQWPLVVALAVVLLVGLARKLILPSLGERWPILLDKRVTLSLVVLVSAGVSVGTALLAGTPISLGLVLGSVVMAALSAIGLYSGAKNALEGGPQGPGPGRALSAVIGREPGQPIR